MMIEALDALSYTLVLMYGIKLAVSFSGGCKDRKERRMMMIFFIASLLVQTSCYFIWGLETTKKLYPLISHLPLFLILVLALKKPWDLAMISILTAYSCCQLPKWFGNLSLYLFDSEISYHLGYIISIVPLFIVLNRYFAVAAYSAMTYSKRSLLMFGGLPLIYYIFDYASTVYTNALYTGVKIVNEFLPTALVVFFVGFISAYHKEMQRRSRLELDIAMLAAQSQQAQNEISALQQLQQQTAAYRHDMRHHLTLLREFLNAGEYKRAEEYIRQSQADIDSIVPARYCENNAVNLILSHFAIKAKKLGLDFSATVNIPEAIPLSDTELCALLSNGLENAITAASEEDAGMKRLVRVNCQPHKDMLLIYIRNPFSGVIHMRDGIPQSDRPGHGFGVKSIKMIAEKNNGYCSFEDEGGMFTLKVVLPLKKSINR